MAVTKAELAEYNKKRDAEESRKGKFYKKQSEAKANVEAWKKTDEGKNALARDKARSDERKREAKAKATDAKKATTSERMHNRSGRTSKKGLMNSSKPN